MLLIPALLAGCDREGGSNGPSGRGSGAGSEMTQRQAENLLMDLPEVRAWQKSVRAGGDDFVPVLTAERGPEDFRAAGDPPAFVFRLAKTNDRQTITWNRFQVDAVDGQVAVWNPFRGEYVPLEQWRERFRPE
jgi:hypothetical protein